MTAPAAKPQLSPELLKIAREAYYDSTRYKSMVADPDTALHAIGTAILAAAKRKPRKKA